MFLLVHKLFIPSSNPASGIFFRFIVTLFVTRVRELQHMRAPKAQLYEIHPSLHDRAGTLASILYNRHSLRENFFANKMTILLEEIFLIFEC